jgi:hypothetical protein
MGRDPSDRIHQDLDAIRPDEADRAITVGVVIVVALVVAALVAIPCGRILASRLG